MKNRCLFFTAIVTFSIVLFWSLTFADNPFVGYVADYPVQWCINPTAFGVECGPFHITTAPGYGGLIDRDHQTFYEKKYFYPDLFLCGYDENDPNTEADDQPGIDYDRSLYKYDLLNRIGTPDANWHNEILYSPLLNNNGEHHLKLLAYPNNRIGGGAWFDTYFSYKCQHLSESAIDAEYVWSDDFFLGSMGNSVTYDDVNLYYVTDKNPGGFIIGKRQDANNNLGDNLVHLPPYKAFFYGNHKQDGFYTLSIEMMKLNSMADPESDICILYYTDKDGDPQECHKKDSDIDGDWEWVDFRLENLSDVSRKFAMRWCGTDVDHGALRVRKIAYECDLHKGLFLSPDQEIPSGVDWDDFIYRFDHDLSMLNHNNFAGFMCPEPYKYAWTPYRKITAALHSQLDNSNNYCLTAQWPANKASDMGPYLDETEVDAMWFDHYPINYKASEGWWHWEASEDGDDGDVDGKSIQHAWRRYFFGKEEDENDAAYQHGAKYAADAAASKNKPLQLGIQTSGHIDWNEDNSVYVQSWIAEPTPRMVRCLCYLAMTLAPRGYFCSYYGPRYSHKYENGDSWAEAWLPQYPFQSDRYQYFNGATVSGLVTLCQNINQPNDHQISTPAELHNAASYGDELGWLWPNPKWTEYSNFIKYIRDIEPIYGWLTYNESSCVEEDGNPI